MFLDKQSCGEAAVMVSTSGMVPEQTKQGAATEAADVNGPRSVLRQLSQDAGLPHEPESRGT